MSNAIGRCQPIWKVASAIIIRTQPHTYTHAYTDGQTDRQSDILDERVNSPYVVLLIDLMRDLSIYYCGDLNELFEII